MAEENEDQQQDESTEDQQTKGGGKLKLIVLILAGIVLLSISIGGTLYLLGFFDTQETKEEPVVDEQASEEPAEPKRSPAMYFPIKPAFVVNFQSRGRQRFLQVDVAIMTRNQAVYSAIQTHLPLIKNRLVMLFGGQVYEQLQTDEGRELLRQQALEAIKQVMEQETGQTEIDQVLFTDFVMQ